MKARGRWCADGGIKRFVKATHAMKLASELRQDTLQHVQQIKDLLPKIFAGQVKAPAPP